MGSWKGRGNQYIQLVKVLYCKLPTNGKQLRAFPLEAVPGTEPRPQRWEASVTTLSPWPPRLVKNTQNRKAHLHSLLLLLLSYIYIAPILKNKALSAVHKQKILLLIKEYSKIV